MKNQFFYTRTVGEVAYRDSLNMNKVIRTITLETGEVMLILDDFHERVSEQPIINTKTNKVTGTKNVRQVMQSEIYLSKEDGERFFQLTSIE